MRVPSDTRSMLLHPVQHARHPLCWAEARSPQIFVLVKVIGEERTELARSPIGSSPEPELIGSREQFDPIASGRPHMGCRRQKGSRAGRDRLDRRRGRQPSGCAKTEERVMKLCAKPGLDAASAAS